MRLIKETYYFSHDSNARNDEKILMLRAEFGMEGYGIYWGLIEMMHEASDTSLSLDKLKGIALSFNTDITLLRSVIDTCITEELFVTDDIVFWSESLRRRKNQYASMKEQRSLAGKKGMEKRWQTQGSDNAVITEPSSVIANHNKGKERKGKESKGKESKEVVGGDHPSDDLKDLMGRLVITWENNGYGSLNPTTATKLLADAEIYSEPWVHDAIIRGNERGKRNYAYMKAILTSWQTSGKDTPKPASKASTDSTKVLGFVEREYDTADLERQLLGR